MIITSLPLSGLALVTPEPHADRRGVFIESYRADIFATHGIQARFAQQNQSRSHAQVIRGLHFQFDPPAGKLVRVVSGEAFAAFVDLRRKSSTFGQSFAMILSEENRLAIFSPPGFAFGFATLAEPTDMQYLLTEVYHQAGDGTIRWNDPALHINWPVQHPIISERDEKATTLAQWLMRPESHIW